MKLARLFRSALILISILGLLAGHPAAAEESIDAPDWSGWHEGVDGLTQAIKLQSETGKPMFVYFYTTWCGYCRQFERVLLTDGDVQDYLDEIIAVRLDAEGGQGELEIRSMYGVNGYPALFMHSGRTRTVSRVTRMEMKDGQARLLEGVDFVKELKNAASR